VQKYYLQYFKEKWPEILYRDHFLQPGDPINTACNQCCIFLSSFSPNHPNVSIEDHLASAKQNLRDSFFFIGSVDDLENSIHNLFDLLGWDRLTIIPQLQTTDIKLKELDEAILNGIRERNWADIELYNYAKQLMAQRLENYKKNNPLIPKSPPLFSTSFRFTALDPLPGEGWTHRELAISAVPPYRKIRPKGEAFFYIPLEEGKNYQMVIKAVVNGIGENKLQVFFNDHKVDFIMDRSDIESVFIYKASIPSLWIEKNRVSFLKFLFGNIEENQLPKWDRISQENWFGIAELNIE
jgi:hypothetical protein